MPRFNAGSYLVGLCLSALLTQAAFSAVSDTLQPLSDAEADAIIAAEAQAKAERHRANLEALGSVPALSEGSYTTDDGTTMIVRQVKARAKPAVVRRPPTPPPPSATAPRKSNATLTAPLPQSMLMIQATLYEGPQTHLTWQHAGMEHSVTLPIDWQAVAEIKNVQTPEAGYLLMHSIRKAPVGSIPPSGGVWANPQDATLPEPLKSLMATYLAEKERLHLLAQRRAALSAARKRHHAQNPPQPETHILNIYDLHATPQHSQP